MGLADREVLAVRILQDLTVERPAELAGSVLDHGKIGLGTSAGDLESDDLAGRVGDGHADHLAILDEFFHFLDEHPVRRSILDGLHVRFKVTHLGFERGDPVAKLGVIVLLGASGEDERSRRENCKEFFHLFDGIYCY